MAIPRLLIGTLSFFCLAMAIPIATAQNPVLDIDGQALETGVEYFILPAVTDVAGGLTLVNRNNSCPLYVGQEPVTGGDGYPVMFKPYEANETIIRESRDLTVEFQAVTICIESLAWRVAEEDPETNRRLIATGGEASYFRIDNNGSGIYNLAFCPTEVCPECEHRPRCGSAGIIEENGQRLLALDGPNAFPFQFRRA